MKFARISFPSREAAIQGYYELARRARVISLPDGQFIVPAPAVDWLQSERRVYELHEWMHGDHVAQTLRNTVADPA